MSKSKTPCTKRQLTFSKEKLLPSVMSEWAGTQSHKPWLENRAVVLGCTWSSKFASGMVYTIPQLWNLLYFWSCEEILIT